jgi:hypothetical protein
MQYIPGTHLVEQLPHLDTFHRDNLLSRGQEIAVEVDRSKALGIALQAGEMSIHHIKLVHGSEPNRSADRRIGFAIRYIPTYVRQTKVRDSAMLVHGSDKLPPLRPRAAAARRPGRRRPRGPRRRRGTAGQGPLPGNRQAGVPRLSAAGRRPTRRRP